MSKGSKQRPIRISRDKFDENYIKAFGNSAKKVRKETNLKCPCSLSAKCTMYKKYGNSILECKAPQLHSKDL